VSAWFKAVMARDNRYDKLGRLIVTRSQIAEASGVNAEQTVGYGYDAIGNRASASVNGVVLTRTTYDPLGRAVETVHASGHKQVRVYAQSGELTALWFDGADTGDLNPVSIDNRGQILNISSSGVRRKTSYGYDGAGRQTAVTDEAGRTTSREYLQNGWLKRIVRPNGDFIQYTYDKVARLTKVEEVAAGYDGTGYALRATLEVKYGYGTYTPTVGTGFSLEVGYNRWVEYVTKKSDAPAYYGTAYFFDKNDRLAEVRFLDDDNATQRKYKYTYDGFGNLAKVEKPDAATIDYTYNKLNQMTQEKFDANNFNDYEYCCCSLIKHQQTVAGRQLDPFELTLDKLHRLTKEQYPDAGAPKTQYFEYKYDNAGRRIEMTDPTYGRAAVEPKPQRWSYDEDGMLINVGHSQNVDYLRNRGEDYGVMYDSRGTINRVLYPGDNNQPVMEVEYQYNDAGQIMEIIARDLTKGETTDIYCMEYEYDGNGRKVRQVIKEQESDLDTDAYYVTTFNYDSRDMLIEEKYLRWDNANTVWKVMYWGRYSYDIAGNMAQTVVYQIVNGNAKSYADTFTYSRGYQLTSFARGTPAVGQAEVRTFTLTYDSNGNMTHIQQNQAFTDSFYDITEMEFDYDTKNRLVKYRFGGAGSWYEIKYDALGRVRERVDLTPTTTKYYSDGRQLIQQLDNSNNVQFDYLRGATGLERQWNESNDTRRFYIKDNLGTVWAIVNPSDLSVKRYNYNAWGEHLDKDDTDFPTDSNSMRYIGCRVEAFGKGTTTQADAIYHLDYRHYLSFLTSFINREPLSIDRLINGYPSKGESNVRFIAASPSQGFFGGFERSFMCGNASLPKYLPMQLPAYLYAANSPSLHSDPSGLWYVRCVNEEPKNKWPVFVVVVFSTNSLCGFTCDFINWHITAYGDGGLPTPGTAKGIKSFDWYYDAPIYGHKWLGKVVYWVNGEKISGKGEFYMENPQGYCLTYVEIHCSLIDIDNPSIPMPESSLLPGYTWIKREACITKLTEKSPSPELQDGELIFDYNLIVDPDPWDQNCTGKAPC